MWGEEGELSLLSNQIFSPVNPLSRFLPKSFPRDHQILVTRSIEIPRACALNKAEAAAFFLFSVEELSTLFGATIARDLDFLFGEFVVVSEFLPGQNASLSEDDDVLESLGTANHARSAVRIA